MSLTAGKRRVLCTLLFGGLPVVMLAGAWRLGGASAIEDDLIYYLPVRAFVGESVRNGQCPLWNPHVMLGTSLAADPQAGLWYPPTLLFAILPALWAYGVMIGLHFAWAGAGMYRFLRAGGYVWPAALLGGIAFEFCGFVVGHRAHLTILQAVAWLPWMLFAAQRLADTGRRVYLALGAAALGAQLLVQHIQISILGGAIVAAYVMVVLVPRRKALLWECPAAALLGVMIGGIQLLPTLAAFSGGTRGAPAYYLFVENSYVPTSLFLWLFPFLFGARTPNFYGQPWWGWSHYCEQATYASIAVLLLATASLVLFRRNRQVRFWAGSGLTCLVIALGRFTPLADVLFHVPLLRSLRVPARWILGVDVAMIVLAVIALDTVLRGGAESELLRRRLRWLATRALPAIVATCLLCMLVARAAADRWLPAPVADSIRAAVRPGNPAIGVPLVVMAATVAVVVRLSSRVTGRRWAAVLGVMLLDFASVAAFVDVDRRQYVDSRMLVDSPLAGEIRARKAAPGERLWVPRTEADYAAPLEVLWPQTNVPHAVSTLHGYGPLWPAESRLLFHFMPWGSTPEALDLLWNPCLLRAFGVRWLAARSEPERILMETATVPPSYGRLEPLAGASAAYRLRGTSLQIRAPLPTPGVYAVELEVAPGPLNRDRWYLWLADESDHPLTAVQWYEPADHFGGRRRIRALFLCREAAPSGWLRGYAERRCDVTVSDIRFGRVAELPGGHAGPSAYAHVAELPGGVTLFELPEGRARYAWANRITPVRGIVEAAHKLRSAPEDVGLPEGIVIEAPPGAPIEVVDATRSTIPANPSTRSGATAIRPLRETPNGVVLDVENASSAFMVFNESFDPGWRATVNGEPVAILRANAVVQAVHIPPGTHRVVFSYWPRWLTVGTVSTGVGLLGTALLAFVGCHKRCRDSNGVPTGGAGPMTP